MRFLGILESGIHCLIFLLLSVFLLAARGANVSTSTALPFMGTTLEVTRNIPTSMEKSHSAKTSASITSTSNGTRAESATATIKTAVPGTSSISRTSPEDLSRITATPSSSLLTTNNTRPSGSSSASTVPVSATGDNITIPVTTTEGPKRKPLKFWAIILICLTVTGVFLGGYVGCCILWKKNIV